MLYQHALNLEPGEFLAVLDLKAQARNCRRVFFSFEDGRKIMATPQWWQKYLGFYEIPIGTHLLLHYKEMQEKECISMPWSKFNRYCLNKQRICPDRFTRQGALRPRCKC